MGRFRFHSSSAALVLAATALFVALGGPAWASSLIGTGQIKNGAITSKKIGRHQVRHVNLNFGAVKRDNIANGAVTAAQVAPGVFLPATGEAQDSKALGGRPATDYLTGSGGLTGAGGMVNNRITVAMGQTVQLLNLGLAVINGSCVAGSPTVSYVSEVPSVNLVASATSSGAPLTSVTPTDNLATGGSFTQPNPTGGAQAVTFQAGFTSGGTSHVATAWTTGQTVSGGCLFVGQAVTTG